MEKSKHCLASVGQQIVGNACTSRLIHCYVNSVVNEFIFINTEQQKSQSCTNPSKILPRYSLVSTKIDIKILLCLAYISFD